MTSSDVPGDRPEDEPTTTPPGGQPGGAGGRPPTDEEILEAISAELDLEEGLLEGATGTGPEWAAVAAERDEYLDALRRVKAEFDNFKRRTAREQAEVAARAGGLLAEKLLPVLDACDAAIGHGATDVEPIRKALQEALEREGLERMAPVGEPFDPNLHEAVIHEPGDADEATVVEELRTGYRWKGQVLRVAMVKVRG